MDRGPSRRRARLAAIGATLGFVVVSGGVALGFREVPPVAPSTRAPIRGSFRGEPIEVVPPPPHEDQGKVDLGARLFADRRLSADGTVACTTCHDLAHGGADGRPTAMGIGGHVGPLNTPTVLNAGLNPTQFWDGRVDRLEDQVDGPIQHPDEMGSRWSDVVARVARDREYPAAFARSYGGAITSSNIKDAIASYERTLLMRDSRFDRYLSGDSTALDAEEREGFRLFKTYGCSSCHQGRNVGGNIFEKLGVFGDYFADRGTEIAKQDLGRYNVTNRSEDRFLFRVPSLRLAALTPPYLHDGTVATLEEAVVVMGRYQLGEEIPATDAHAIATFLGSLAGTLAAGTSVRRK